jgi:hypothetical protein
MRATDPATAAVDWEDLTYSWAGSQLILANTQTGTICHPRAGSSAGDHRPSDP